VALRERRFITWLVVVSVCSFVGAVLVSSDCMGDGTFDPDSPGATPNGFCQQTHFPGLPDSRGSALLVGLMFGGPVLVVLAAGLLAAITKRPRIGAGGFYLGLVLAGAVTFLGLVLADTGFRGAV
jgi:hypothetical protein